MKRTNSKKKKKGLSLTRLEASQKREEFLKTSFDFLLSSLTPFAAAFETGVCGQDDSGGQLISGLSRSHQQEKKRYYLSS